MGKKKDKEGKKPKVNKELEGFNIQINTFGEIVSDYDLDEINSFLNRNVDDKELRDRNDVEQAKGKSPDNEK